jgi:hypothetical protein
MGKRQGLTYKQVLGLSSADASGDEIAVYALLDRDDGLNCTLDANEASRLLGRHKSGVYRSLKNLSKKQFVMNGRLYPVIELVKDGNRGGKAVWFDRLKFETIGGLPF